MIGIEESNAQDSTINDDCINVDTKNPICDEKFRPQSVKVFSVIDSSVGIIEDPETKLTIVDIGTFYGIGGNRTIPDTIEVYRDDTLWKTTTKETGIAPSTSHSEWQIPQTFFFNELPGLYKLVLIINNTETLVYEFMVKQITEKSEGSLDNNVGNQQINDIIAKMTPLKQIENGVIPSEIICKEGLQLVFKNTDDGPACVKPASVNKLIERNWAKPFSN